MSDWIDKLKKSEQVKLTDLSRQEEIRLHKAKIIRAKASAFWAALKERVQADCDKLKAEFPNDKYRDCYITELPTRGFTINGGGLPRHILNLELNLDGLCIDTFETEKSDRVKSPVPTKGHGQIDIEVGDSEELLLRFNGILHRDLESLSEHLVSYVARIRSN